MTQRDRRVSVKLLFLINLLLMVALAQVVRADGAQKFGNCLTACNFSYQNISMDNVTGKNSQADGIEDAQSLREQYTFVVCKEPDSKLVSWWTVLRHHKATSSTGQGGYEFKFDGTTARMFVANNGHETQVASAPYKVDADTLDINVTVKVYNYTFYVYNNQSGTSVLMFSYTDATHEASGSGDDIALYSQAGTDYDIMSYSGKLL